MPTEVWEYTPSGQPWWERTAEETPVAMHARSNGKMPVRWADSGVVVLLACVLLGCAHQFRVQRVHAAATANPQQSKFASFTNCKLMLPGVQPVQMDGDPTHTQFHPYNYTVCDGVEVTLWSEVR